MSNIQQPQFGFGSASTDPSGVTTTATYANPPSTSAPGSASQARMSSAGLTAGARPSLSELSGQVFNFAFNSANGDVTQPEKDWRVRISLSPNMLEGAWYNDPSNFILSPLAATKGVIFPYTPQITIEHSANYEPGRLAHINYLNYFYQNSEVREISIQGEFTVQNYKEGQYLMAVIHFFRAVTKMYYGQNDQLAGTPPPLVFLDGYGVTYLPHVPCVVTRFSHTMPNDVDYVEVPIGNTDGISGNQLFGSVASGIPTRLPTSSTISLTLQPIYSGNNISSKFSMRNFVSGLALNNGFI